MATDDDDIPDTGAVFTFGKSRFADNTANKFWIRNDKVIHVSCGDDHTAFVTASGRLYTFGANDWGQLGLGHTKSSNKPASVKALKQNGVVIVGCGRLHTLVCTKAGQLYAFGAGGEGQLGGGDTQGVETPIAIGSLEEAEYKAISCGTDHTAVLTAEGLLYMFGGSSDGQLGLGNITETEIPRELTLGIAVKHVSCGYYHTALVTEDGKLYTFGENEMGKLGLGDDQVDVSSNTPQHVDSIEEPVKCVSCGNSHTAAITDSGSLYTFGDGSHGQLGQGSSLLQLNIPRKVTRLNKRKCRRVSCGESHTAVITDTGSLYTFGDGRHGKLGQGEESFSNLFTPTKVSRFKGFYVEQVSCGGCHMIVRARRRDTSNGEVSDESDIDEADPLKLSSGLQARLQSNIADIDNKLEHSLDLNASLGGTARGRRRQKESSQLPPLARTLPPLGGTGTPRSQLSSLSATTKPSSNPLNQGLLPMITHEQDEDQTSRTNDEEEDSEDDSDEDEALPADPFATRFVSASGNWHDLQPINRNRSHKVRENSKQTHFSRSGARQDMKPLLNAMHKAKRKEKKEQMKAKQNGTVLRNGKDDELSQVKSNGNAKHADEEDNDSDDEDDDEEEDDSDEDESEDEDAMQKTRQEMKQKSQLDKEKQLQKEASPKKPSKANPPIPAARTLKVANKKTEEEDDDDEDDDDEDDDDDDDDDEDDDEDEDENSNETEKKPIDSKATKPEKQAKTENKPKKSSKQEEDDEDDDEDDDEEEEADEDDEKENDKKKDEKANKKESKENDKKEPNKEENEPEEIKTWQFWKRKKKTEPEPEEESKPTPTPSGDQNQSKTCTIL